MVMESWLGLGSNMQQPVRQIQVALNRLGEAEGIEILATSSFYRTTPWGDEQQDDFINAVVQIETSLDPETLLCVLQAIENVMGRQRSARRWGPRLIDIDLLLYGASRQRSTELEIPHPRMHERAFVLSPLAELNANLEIPGRGNVARLLQRLDCSGVSRLTGGARAQHDG
jgi:2-amino-4-hydroxy-6-hydroxymethyldihydropteridine diphosphokinase